MVIALGAGYAETCKSGSGGGIAETAGVSQYGAAMSTSHLMQCTSKTYPVSFVVTDPKGDIVIDCGKLLRRNGYRIKIFNTINLKKSMHYNPFAYIHSEKDILKLVTTLISNTKGEQKGGDEFWTKAKTLLYCALIGYIHYAAPVEEQNFTTLIEFINAMEVREDDEEFMKKVICVLACVIALMLTGCQGQGDLTSNTPPVHSSNVGETPPGSDSPTSSPSHSTDFPNPGGDPGEVDTSGFQREMNVHHPFHINTACKTENGYYFEYSWFLYFMDAASGEMIVVCSKPECGHNSKDCNAYIQANLLSYYQGKLYYVTTAYLDADYHSIDTLCSMNLDGTSHTDLQKVRIDLTTPRVGCADPLLINGTVYFMEANHSIYRMALGHDVSKATLLLEESIHEKMANTQAFTSNTDWEFWADGDDIYAMCHVFTRSGEYVDILYFLGADRSDSREIWRSSEIGISGQRDNISSWYILNGHLYYYFSGFDLWDIDLNGGEAVTLVRLANTIKSGTAVFTDHYAIVLDDQSQTNSAGLYRQGGKNISVYDYSGNLLKSVDLSFIYEEYPNTYHCELIFADGNTVFLQGYIGMDNGTTSHLYQINWESGTAREINSWPASDVP